jgi:hypothetical protein
VTSHDVGHRLRLIVTASNAGGSASVTTPPTVPALPAGSSPKNTSKPSIAGTAQQGKTLTARVGSWKSSGAPISYLYQWYRCDAGGDNCGAIGSAIRSTYKLTTADVGHRIRVVVAARNALGSAQATSDATSAIAHGIAASNVSLPNRLVIASVRFDPRAIFSRTTPVVARFRVVDSAGRPVSGALVYAIGVPANRVVQPPKARTGGNGWAHVVFRPARGLPFKDGARLTFFVRARKPGGSILGGVSTRRLVSLAVHPR